MLYIALYLLAIVIANLTVTLYGPSVSIINAFLLIGLDLTTRDKLHDAWRGQGLAWKMALLIATGSLLSWLLNRDAGPIALASFVAFASAATVDTAAYHLLRQRSWYIRVNVSNAISATVDSIVFVGLAFGVFLWPIMVGQIVAKTCGGAAWSFVLRRKKYARAVA